MQSLERRLGLFSVVTIGISSMVATGIFVLPGIGLEVTGPSLFLAYLAAGVAILPAALSKAELATAMPTSGGAYVYIERAFGPLAGTVSGLGLYLSILLKVAFALVGLGAYSIVFTSMDMTPIILGCVGMITLLNIGGIGKVSSLLTLILAMTLLGLGALFALSQPHVNVDNLTPLFTSDMDGFVAATAIVFISYAGILKVAAIAEEVKNPEKTIPNGILLSLLIAMVLYSLVALFLALVFPHAEIAGSIRPIFKWADKIAGPVAASTMAGVAILTIINSSNAGVLAGSRFPFAMSRDNLLPSSLGRLNKRFMTPVPSILLSGGIIVLSILFLNIDKIAKLASAFMILIYMLENLCVMVLRETKPQWYTPGYKAPLYPALQIFGLLSGAVFLYAMGTMSLVAILSIAVPGALFYFFYSRKKTTRRGVLGIKGKRPDIIEMASTLSPGNEDFYKTSLRSQVVVGLFGKERSPDMLIEMGLSLTDKGQVEVASLIELPEQTNLQDVVEEPAQIRSLRRRALAMTSGDERSIHFDSIVTHDLAHSIFEISHLAHCEWLLVEWKGKKRGSLTINNPIGWLKSHLHCHLAVFRDAGIRYIRKIMVLLNDDRNDRLILDRVRHFSQEFGARIILTKHLSAAVPKEKIDHELEYLNGVASKISDKVEVQALIGNDPEEDIIKETVNFDLFILGSGSHNFFTSFKGAFDERLTARAACSVLVLHASEFSEHYKE